MARRGRKPVLDEFKRREILAILSVGCSRRTAARYVGCAATTIQNTARRDRDFAAAVSRAETISEVGYLQSIQNAAKQERYWRAAAWALERRNPEEFALRRPDVLTVRQVRQLLDQVACVVADEVLHPKVRKRMLHRVHAIITELKDLAQGESPGEEHTPGEEHAPDDTDS